MVAWVLLKQNHFEDSSFRKNTLGDSAFGGRWFDSSHHIGGEDTGSICEAIERFHRVDDSSLAVIFQGFDLATFINDLKFIEIVAKIQRVLQGD